MTTQKLKEMQEKIDLLLNPAPLPTVDDLLSEINEGRLKLIEEQGLLQGIVFNLVSACTDDGVELECLRDESVCKVARPLDIDSEDEIFFPNGSMLEVENCMEYKVLLLSIPTDSLENALISLGFKIDISDYTQKLGEMSEKISAYDKDIKPILLGHTVGKDLRQSQTID